jgi:hypothetical protein
MNLGDGCLRILCYLLSFPMLTHTHIFSNPSDGYSHLKTAHVRSSMDCRKSESSTDLYFDMVTDSGEIMPFKRIIKFT